jgi:hypothetical protein
MREVKSRGKGRVPDVVATLVSRRGQDTVRSAPRLHSSQILCFTLLDSRRNQRERRCVMRCNERLAIRTEMNAWSPVRMCWLYSSSYKVRSYPSRVNWLS